MSAPCEGTILASVPMNFALTACILAIAPRYGQQDQDFDEKNQTKTTFPPPPLSQSCPKPRKFRYSLYCRSCRITGHSDEVESSLLSDFVRRKKITLCLCNLKRCHRVWRVYDVDYSPRIGKVSAVSCYNCASRGHFGDVSDFFFSFVFSSSPVC